MRELEADEVRAFLLAGTRTAKVAVVRRDGSPLVTPVWFLLDDEQRLVFETDAGSVKARALARDPRVSVCVDDERPPYGFVRVDGTAELERDAPDLLAWTTRLAARYVGTERAEELGRRHARPEALLVRVRPLRVVAQVELAV